MFCQTGSHFQLSIVQLSKNLNFRDWVNVPDQQNASSCSRQEDGLLILLLLLVHLLQVCILPILTDQWHFLVLQDCGKGGAGEYSF